MGVYGDCLTYAYRDRLAYCYDIAQSDGHTNETAYSDADSNGNLFSYAVPDSYSEGYAATFTADANDSGTAADTIWWYG
jgi:hypothetical protein